MAQPARHARPQSEGAGTAQAGWAVLAPVRQPAFRWQWLSDLCAAWALEMETLILGWYVLVESGSVVMLTVFGALMYGGTLLSPLIGTFGDRIGLRRLLVAMRLVYAALACAILLMAAADGLSPAPVLAVAFVVGLVKPSDIGMRTALVSASVPPSQMAAAMGISRTTQDSARIGGALAGAGFMASLGMVSAYWMITGLYLLAVVLTLRSAATAARAATAEASETAATAVAAVAASSGDHRPFQSVALRPAGAAPPVDAAPFNAGSTPWQSLRQGLQHVWHTPPLRAAMLLAALVNLCAFPLSGGLMPYIARDVFGLDQQGLGWLVASWATGALAGSLALSAFGTQWPPARTMLATCAVWYLCLLALALPMSAGAAKGLFLLAGLMQSLSMVALSIVLLRISEQRFRGRVMGARMLAIYTLPIGLLTAGALIPRIGFAALVVAYAAFGLMALALLTWGWRAHLWSPQAPANRV